MVNDSVHRSVTVERITQGVFTVTNTRGGQLKFGTGSGTEFTPTELLLAAIGGCTAIDIARQSGQHVLHGSALALAAALQAWAAQTDTPVSDLARAAVR